MSLKNFLRPAIFTGVVLTAAGIANHRAEGFDWSAFDFVWVTVVLMSAGLILEFVASRSSNLVYKVAVGLAVLGSLMLVWVNAAVGALGNEDNPANIMYFAVIVVGLIGLASSRFQAKKMATTMFAMTAVLVLVPIIAIAFWGMDSLIDGPGVTTAFEIVGITVFFGTFFIVSGLLFRHAAEDNKEIPA